MKIYATGLTVLLLFAQAVWGEAPQQVAEPSPDDSIWLDTSREYVVDKADNIAIWMDNFFGVSRVDEEAPYSTLRLRAEQEWDEMEGWDTGLKLRGKVHLPKLNKRVSLLFSDDDDDKTGNDDLLIDKQNSPDDVALQYTARERKNYRVDFKVGLRSSLHPKTSVRYRYEHAVAKNLLGRFSQEALYRGDDGFGSRTRLDFDKILGDHRVLQWYNRLEWEEEESGLSWDTGLALNRRIGEHSALGYYVALSGKTDPDHYSDGYGFGMRYRQNIYKDWLFAEVQPNYFWRRDEFEDSREGAAAIMFRLEAVFTRDWD